MIIGDPPDAEIEQHRGRKGGGVDFPAADGVGCLIDGEKDGDRTEFLQHGRLDFIVGANG